VVAGSRAPVGLVDVLQRRGARSPGRAEVGAGQGLTLILFSAQRKRFLWDG